MNIDIQPSPSDQSRRQTIDHRMPDSFLVRAGRSHRLQKPGATIQKQTRTVFVCDWPKRRRVSLIECGVIFKPLLGHIVVPMVFYSFAQESEMVRPELWTG